MVGLTGLYSMPDFVACFTLHGGWLRLDSFWILCLSPAKLLLYHVKKFNSGELYFLESLGIIHLYSATNAYIYC